MTATLTLPPAPQPVATYVGAVRTGNQIWISGQGPTWGAELRFTGKVGSDLSVDEGREAARLTALNLLAQAAQLLDGDLGRISRCLKLFGLVNAAPGFDAPHLVVNGASDLLVEALGEDAGPHARAAVCARNLPFAIAVELDAVFEVA